MNVKSWEKIGCVSVPQQMNQVLKRQQPNISAAVRVINADQRTIRKSSFNNDIRLRVRFSIPVGNDRSALEQGT